MNSYISAHVQDKYSAKKAYVVNSTGFNERNVDVLYRLLNVWHFTPIATVLFAIPSQN